MATEIPTIDYIMVRLYITLLSEQLVLTKNIGNPAWVVGGRKR